MTGNGAEPLNGALSPESRNELGNTGLRVSPVGFGGGPLGNEFGHVTVRFLSAVFPINWR